MITTNTISTANTVPTTRIVLHSQLAVAAGEITKNDKITYMSQHIS